MTPKEKTFREIIRLEDEIEVRKQALEVLYKKASVHNWTWREAEGKTQRLPGLKWFEEKQPEIHKTLIEFVVHGTKKGNVTDGGYKDQIKDEMRLENLEIQS